MSFSPQIDSSALVNHVVSQTRQNVEFLMSQNHITESLGREILFKLPHPSPVTALTEKTQSLTISSASSRNTTRSVPPPVRKAEARAIWDWTSEDPSDLNFKTGDIVEIINETNTDWWTGRHNGRQGLFPSTYVEKIKNNASITSAPPPFPDIPRVTSPYHQPTYAQPAPMGPPSGPPSYTAPAGPPPGNYYNYQAPSSAPPPAAYNPYMAPTAPLEAIPQQEPKKSRFGGLGNTMAQSAAGGVGFGAGSAVGSGIINAIF